MYICTLTVGRSDIDFLRFFKQSHCCGSGTVYLYKFNSKKSVSLAANVANVAKFFIFKKLQEP